MMALKNALFEGTVQSWGNSLGVRITQPIGKLAHLVKGTEVELEVTSEGLLIRPKISKPTLLFSEADLIKGLTPKKAHADELPSPLSSEFGE